VALERDFEPVLSGLSNAFELYALATIPNWLSSAARRPPASLPRSVTDHFRNSARLLSEFDHIFRGGVIASTTWRAIPPACSYLPLRPMSAFRAGDAGAAAAELMSCNSAPLRGHAPGLLADPAAAVLLLRTTGGPPRHAPNLKQLPFRVDTLGSIVLHAARSSTQPLLPRQSQPPNNPRCSRPAATQISAPSTSVAAGTAMINRGCTARQTTVVVTLQCQLWYRLRPDRKRGGSGSTTLHTFELPFEHQ